MNCLQNISEKNCTGCRACEQSCPKGCIKIIENEIGFLIPQIAEQFCINCGLCTSGCPMRKSSRGDRTRFVYAAKAKNKELLRISTSGGAFGILANHLIDKGGIVFGCVYSNNFEVCHIAVSNSNDIKALHGSKYVQSDTRDTFKQTRELLRQGKNILYSGTACQIAGLKSFLRKKYDNLLTVEVVCHGVPSPRLFRKYIEWIELKEKSKVLRFSFRSKIKRPTGEHYKSRIVFEKGTKFKFAFLDPYYAAFLDGKTLRECCYECKFKSSYRIADITIGDFWGIEKRYPQFPADEGVSLILINTVAGTKLFSEVSEQFELVVSSLEDAVRCNPSVLNSTPRLDKNYYVGLNDLTVNDYFSNLRPEVKAKSVIKNLIPYRLKRFLKKRF